MGILSRMKKMLDGLAKQEERALSEVRHRLQELLILVRNDLPVITNVQTLTYEDAIAYFVNARPQSAQVKKGALLRQKSSQEDKISILQVFLDEHNELVCAPGGKPYGRHLVVQDIDQDLTETFQNSNLIIVE